MAFRQWLRDYVARSGAAALHSAHGLRLIGSEKIWERGAALISGLQSFETDLLTQEENLAGLAAINRELIAKAETIESPQSVMLDMDSTEISVYGQQENSAYNGHFGSTCYHPLLLFNREGDCLAAKPRPGNVHSAEDWEELLLPEGPEGTPRQQKLGKEVVFRADAAFAKTEIYETPEERGVKSAIRIPSNDNLEQDIAELLTRPVGRPSHKPVVWYKGFLYQAASWKTARRVVAKVEFHFGELIPRVGFIVTNLETDSRSVVRLLLSLIAYNLRNLWRRLVLPKKIGGWSLTRVPQRLVKTGGRLIKHARYYWLLLTESHLTRRLFGVMVGRIAVLPTPTGWGAVAGKETGRREEGDGEVREKSLERKHFRVFPCPEGGRAGPFLGRRSGSGYKGLQKITKKVLTEAIGCILEPCREAKTEIPVEGTGEGEL